MNKKLRTWISLAALIAIFVYLISNMALWRGALGALFPHAVQTVYPGADLTSLVEQHLVLVGISSLLTVLIGVPLGLWVTCRSGAEFLPVINTVVSFGQTFPPVAVLALAVPALGFGLKPTVVALFLYGLLPVVRNTIAGLQSVPPEAIEASTGLGMSRWQNLINVEIPIALPVILAGIRISVVINVGTAMIGATIGAGALGVPIIAGLVQNEVSLVLEGAIPAAFLAILLDQFFNALEHTVSHAERP